MKTFCIFVPGIIMVGLVLRGTFCRFADCPTDNADGLHVSLCLTGLLTSLPQSCLPCSSFLPSLGTKFGLEKLFTMVLIILTIDLYPIINLPFLFMQELS